jgi:hypothetical protein
MAERTKATATPIIKCCRTSCARTTRSPKASGWIYVGDVGDEAPLALAHWVGGWLCPQCWKGFQKLMADQGVTPTVERLN